MDDAESIDYALQQRWLDGDAAALAVLHAHCRQLAASLAPLYRFHRQEADDLGDAFYLSLTEGDCARLRRYRAREGSAPSAWQTWLTWQFRSFLSHALRSRFQHPEQTLDPAILEAWFARNAPDAEAEALAELQAEGLRARLAEWLARLTEAERTVLVLHAVEGVKHAEIARRLGISEAAVWKRHERARGKLRRWLGSEWSG